jgi:osmotically-inducible protein OsmY
MTIVDSPSRTRCQVEAAIERRCGWDIRDLQVEVLDGLVVLRGQASTYYAKQLAQHTAMAVTGLTVVANEINVI